MQTPVTCSVVLGTLAGWPQRRRLLEPLLRQVRNAQGELVVADGTGQPPPGELDADSSARWLSIPGAGIFDLRLAALQAARGAIVVVTEDHCLVPPDWCRRIIDLHAQHPEADVITGTVDNGSRSRSIDWAAFIVNHLPNMPPIDTVLASARLGINGVSYKRRALDVLLRDFPRLTPELVQAPALRRLRLRVVCDESLVVSHVQAETWLGHGALHYHNARAVLGSRRPNLTPRDWFRLAAAPALVPARTWRTIVGALQKGLPRRVVWQALPGVFWLRTCKGVGEWAGFVAGPGDSARRLQ
jgi:Glycosyl transferase family 2